MWKIEVCIDALALLNVGPRRFI